MGGMTTMKRTLTGKIFVKLGESFKISEFVDDQNEIDRALNDDVNLKS